MTTDYPKPVFSLGGSHLPTIEENLRKLLDSLWTVGEDLKAAMPNARDYPSFTAFEGAKAIYQQRFLAVERIRASVTQELEHVLDQADAREQAKRN